MPAALTIEEALATLADPTWEYGGSSSATVELAWQLTAHDYLTFARQDMDDPTARGLVNGLGNAKRSLHCQIDSLVFSVGLWSLPGRGRWNFNDKTSLLSDLDIVTPGVLRRINRLRNSVEHEYSVPESRERLEDFVDAVELFVAATDSFVRSRWSHMDFDNRDGDSMTLSRTDGADDVEVILRRADGVRRLKVPAGDDVLREVVVRWFALRRGGGVAPLI